MSEIPKISIIVPLFNKVKEVCRAIDSIFAQTVQDFELLVVDGGSTDGSLNAIKKYESDSRFHIIHQKSTGLPAGRDEGIAASSADIVAFLDADDEWCPDFLEKILNLRDKFPDAGLYAAAYLTCYEDSVEKPRLFGIPAAPWEGILPSYFRTSALAFIYPFAPSSVAIPKTTFEKIGLFKQDLRTGEDVEMWGRIALELPIAFTSAPKVYYHAVAENRMTDNPQVMKRHPF
ncbi:MAG TPA: glycosyltransferase family A protein, partial [Methanocorpusculum sp.]|nr:glycosyltransferase family A protein [Methanocorpusculum sp.]